MNPIPGMTTIKGIPLSTIEKELQITNLMVGRPLWGDSFVRACWNQDGERVTLDSNSLDAIEFLIEIAEAVKARRNKQPAKVTRKLIIE